MEVAPKHSLHSDLPESAQEPDYLTYKFSVPESPYPHSTIHALPAGAATPPFNTYGETETPSDKPGKWTRWPLLLIYGLLLAVIAGVVGGFIGKNMERSNQKAGVVLENETCPTPTSVSAPSAPSASPLSSAAPTPSSAVFERVIPQPSSGCDASAPFRSFKSRSQRIDVPFTTICGQGWLGDDISAMSVASQSDCIETCSTYNSYTRTGDRMCVGGGFIPEWWNQTRAMVESGITPYNCFLKSNTSGIARNNEKFEVIALCLDGQCDGIS